MRMIRSLTLLALALLSTEAWGQSGNVTPHIGYLYPAGGKQGTIVNVMAGGQYMRLARQVYVTGEGVHAEVVDYAKQLRLKGEERIEVQRQLSERWAELTGREGPLMRRRPPRGKPAEEGPVQEDAGPVELPHHPLLNNLDSLSLLELQHVMRELFTSKEKMQRNRQLAEMVVIEVTIDPDAPPGDRELRIETRMGLTNPLCFQVGTLPELQELEPNDGEPPPESHEDGACRLARAVQWTDQARGHRSFSLPGAKGAATRDGGVSAAAHPLPGGRRPWVVSAYARLV